MTSDEIIKKVKEEDSIELLDFIKLAILQEREECAKIVDNYIGADQIAAAIRARKQT